MWTAPRAGSARSRVRGVSSTPGGAAQLGFRKPDPFPLLEFFPLRLTGQESATTPRMKGPPRGCPWAEAADPGAGRPQGCWGRGLPAAPRGLAPPHLGPPQSARVRPGPRLRRDPRRLPQPRTRGGLPVLSPAMKGDSREAGDSLPLSPQQPGQKRCHAPGTEPSREVCPEPRPPARAPDARALRGLF